MKVTILAPFADVSGGARVIHIYAMALHKRGHTVHLVTRPQPHRSFRQRLKLWLKGGGWLPAVQRDAPSHYSAAEYSVSCTDSVRAMTAYDVPDADIVIATWWETAEWMAAFPASKGRHAHFVQHYEAFGQMPKDRVDNALRMAIPKITISQWLEDLLANKFGNTDITLIFNSVDTNQFFAPVRTRQAQPTVGMLYSTIDWKDCRSGFAAIELLRARLPDLRLITFGNSAEHPDVPLPLGTKHIVLPPQQDIRHIYASCDVWFCSSTSEGFHLPPLEAMACRCPVISTRVGGPIDIIDEGVNGFLVPIGDVAQMAGALERFFQLSAEQWQAMSDAAHQTAVRYTWDNAADLFEAALLKISQS